MRKIEVGDTVRIPKLRYRIGKVIEMKGSVCAIVEWSDGSKGEYPIWDIEKLPTT